LLGLPALCDNFCSKAQTHRMLTVTFQNMVGAGCE
jgi:hypothetical protein